MSEVAIPPASLERLRAAYASFEQLAQVVSEAMGLQGKVTRVELQHGTFVVEDEAHANGVAKEVPA